MGMLIPGNISLQERYIIFYRQLYINRALSIIKIIVVELAAVYRVFKPEAFNVLNLEEILLQYRHEGSSSVIQCD